MRLLLRKCFCGASEQGFQKDIGPNFVGLCCEDKGYDHLGNPPAGTPRTAPPPPPANPYEGAFRGIDYAQEKLSPPQPISFPGPEVKMGRGKLRDLTVEVLVNMAASRGLDYSNKNKMQIVQMIFDAQSK